MEIYGLNFCFIFPIHPDISSLLINGYKMRQWREYEKTYRIQVPQFQIPHGKFSLSHKEVQRLLTGYIVITEKMDGADTGIYKRKDKFFLQKRRGNTDDSHEQFKFFKNQWMHDNYEKIESLPENTVTYGELMRCVHSIYYDKLPDWFLVFDIYDLNKERYLTWIEVVMICEKVGLSTVPYIGCADQKLSTHDLGLLVPKESKYGDTAEGIVIKNYKKQVRGKIVKPEFVKTVDDSDDWTKLPVRYNKLAS